MARPSKIIIHSNRYLLPIDFAELWSCRELLYFFVWRDVKVRYKQAFLGIIWVFLRPVTSMAIFSVIFGKISGFQSTSLPYPIFVFLGLLPWSYFSSSVTSSANSLVENSNLITKIYFPRIFVPVSGSLANLLDLAISMIILFLMMWYYNIVPHVSVVAVPVLLVALFLTAIGPGLLLGALNVKYRDIGYIIPFLVQVGFFVSPVLYPVSFISEKYRFFMYLNPMTAIIECFRYCFTGDTVMGSTGLMTSVAMSLTLLIVSLYCFRYLERSFADVI